MKRTRTPSKPDALKRKGTQGQHSEYWKVWNEHHPEDFILPETGFIIHHIDGNPNNNAPENLQKMTDIEHKKYHVADGRHPNQGKKFPPSLRKKLSDSHKGQVAWNKGKKTTEETKKKIRAAIKGRTPSYGMLGKKHSEETKEKMRGRIPWNKGIKTSINEKNKK